MLAMLFAMVSMLSCCAFMPVAAMARDFTASFLHLDRHPNDFLIGLHDLVANRDCRLQGPLGRHQCLDDFPRRLTALDRRDRSGFTGLERTDRVRGHLLE